MQRALKTLLKIIERKSNMNENLLHRISQIIVECAEKNEVIEYNRISKLLGGIVSPIRLNEPLGEISDRCIKLGFPPLSAIVVNQDTRLPGQGFFTWVAAQMGYPNLIPSKWEEFYHKQEEKVFDCVNWDVFLADAFSIKGKAESGENNNISIEELFTSHLFLKGKRTKYYILTTREIPEGSNHAHSQYRVLIVEDGKLVKEATVKNNEDKYLLMTTKRKGIQLLLERTLLIPNASVTMAHHIVNEHGMGSWEKEPIKSLYLLLSEGRQKVLSDIGQSDIEAEVSQEDSFYKDGNEMKYYGTRYERNPINRARAIEIHGMVCKACDFNFEKAYGELGKGFIEVHHIRPLSSLDKEILINPEKDLVPLCSNCHRMIHRKKDEVLKVEQLKAIYKSFLIHKEG